MSVTSKDVMNLRPADQYDYYATNFMGPWDELLMARLRELFTGKCGGGILLDIGTGTAVLPSKLARKEDFVAWTFIALDRFPDEVRVGQERVKALNLSERIEVCLGDAHALPCADNSLTCVLSRATLHHLRAPIKALQEMYRVLEPGGLGLVHDMRRDVEPAAFETFSALRQAAGYPPTHLDEKYTVAEVHAILEKAKLSADADVYTGQHGVEALGYEILIRKQDHGCA
jgi:ubiquinone/menaquinone biosynthesis C-methylase UbiE